MKIHQLKHNLCLVEFKDIEEVVFSSVKKEFEKIGINSFEEIPRKDYIKLLQYFTLQHICKLYNSFQNKKNTIIFVNQDSTNKDVLQFLKEIKKYFPIPIYLTQDIFIDQDPAIYLEITLKVKEFRYSLDYSKYSFNKIKKFCKLYNLENLTTDFKP